MDYDTVLHIQVVVEPHRSLPYQVYAGPHLVAACPDSETFERARRGHLFASLRSLLLAECSRPCASAGVSSMTPSRRVAAG